MSAALDQGDNRAARAALETLLRVNGTSRAGSGSESSVDAETRTQAQKLLASLGFDRAAIALTAGCALFFLFVVYSYLIK